MSILSTEFIQTSIRVVNVTNEIRGAHVMSLTAIWIKVMYRTSAILRPDLSVRCSTRMALPPNKPLRNLGIYKLRDRTLIALKRSEELTFLFSEKNWTRHGPVEYRVSHGSIYRRGWSTGLRDADLVDTGRTANEPQPSILITTKKH